MATIVNGVITGAADPDNEGKTIREVLLREANNLYREMNYLANVFDDGPESVGPVMRTLLAGADHSAGRISDLLWQLSKKVTTPFGEMSITDIIAHYRASQKSMVALSDCGVLADFSNMGQVFDVAFGVDSPKAQQNFSSAAAMIAAMNVAVTWDAVAATAAAAVACIDGTSLNVVNMDLV